MDASSEGAIRAGIYESKTRHELGANIPKLH